MIGEGRIGALGADLEYARLLDGIEVGPGLGRQHGGAQCEDGGQ